MRASPPGPLSSAEAKGNQARRVGWRLASSVYTRLAYSRAAPVSPSQRTGKGPGDEDTTTR